MTGAIMPFTNSDPRNTPEHRHSYIFGRKRAGINGALHRAFSGFRRVLEVARRKHDSMAGSPVRA
jgi:hypothetical protein